jgi:WD40 repeat protein/serine/threonine protein kinase
VSAERSDTPKTIFLEALDRPKGERTAFLDEACGDDSGLRSWVEELLAAHDTADRVLGDELPGLVADPEPGTRIGPYRLRERVGEGGFGVVFRAEQEEPVRRDVALKVLRAGLDSEQVASRFEAERQALALMDHPDIARVYDAGETADGRPYFVMEYVAGVPITEHCDADRMDLRARLHLFQRVCQAVQHAHSKGIIHRDIKPTNVLVSTIDGEPAPKIIDFGIAKATGSRLTDRTLVTQHLMGTPEYMSPEQAASAEDIDTRTDVYSLGVLLYELIAGVSPYDPTRMTSAGLVGMVEMICKESPVRPSSRLRQLEEGDEVAARLRTSRAHLVRELRSDLDWIVVKAMEKEPALRYPTANALADDVRRYLAHEPVVAGPPSLGYRWRKLFQRNRAAAIALIALVGVVLLATFVNARAALRTRDARSLADRRLYVASVQAAELALGTRDVVSARRYLESAPEELRRWEWDHIAQRIDRSAWTHRRPGQRPLRIAFSPEGEEVAVKYGDGTVLLLDVATGEERSLLSGLEESPGTLVFGATGRRIAAGDRSGRIMVWEVDGSRPALVLEGHTQVATQLALTSDEAVLFSGSEDGTVRVWDLEEGLLLSTFAYDTPVGWTRLSPDERTLAVSLWDQTLRLIDPISGRERHGLHVASEATAVVPSQRFAPAMLSSLDFSSDGRLLATAARDGHVTVWDHEQGLRLFQDDLPLLVRRVVFSPDNRRLACSGWDWTVALWDVSTGTRITTLRDHVADVRTVDFSPDSRRLASTSFDRGIRIWNAENGAPVAHLTGHESALFGALYSPDGEHLLSYDGDGDLKCWRTRGLVDTLVLEEDGTAPGITVTAGSGNWVFDVQFLRDGRICALTMDHSVKVWNPETASVEHELPATGTWRRLALSPDERIVATGDQRGLVEIWDLFGGERLGRFVRLRDAVGSMLFTTDGERLFTGDNSANIVLWDVESGDELANWRLETTVRELLHSPDGEAALLLTEGGEILRLVPEPDAAPELFARLDTDIMAGSLDPTGEVLAIGCGLDHSIRLLDARTGEELARLEGHADRVSALAWLPDGSRLVSGGEDRAVRLWDPVTGEPLCYLRGHLAELRGLAVSPDGHTIVTSGQDSTIRLWTDGG